MKIEIINPKRGDKIHCPKCRNIRIAEFSLKDRDYWVQVRECQYCGDKRKILTKKFLDLLQPSSELFELVYGNPFREAEQNKKQMAMAEEKRKEFLDRKYDQKFKKPWERKLVKDWVFGREKLW